MERRSVEAIVRALNDAGVRYLIVGGMAVVAHGYVRFTADLDLILGLDDENLRRAMDTFERLGFVARVPVPMRQFADAEIRAGWVREKGMVVFSLTSPNHARTGVDLFATPPFDFDRAYGAAVRFEVAPGLFGTFACFDDLIALKRQAGRPRDIEDIRQLERIREQP